MSIVGIVGDRGSVKNRTNSQRPATKGSLAVHQVKIVASDPVAIRLHDAPYDMRKEIAVFMSSCIRPITVDNVVQQFKKYCENVMTSMAISVRFDGRIEVSRVHGNYQYRICTTLDRLIGLPDPDSGGLPALPIDDKPLVMIARAASMTSASEA